MNDEYWPAVFFNIEAQNANRLDTLEVPGGTTFLLDFMTITTNIVGKGEANPVTFVLMLNDTPIYEYIITSATFFGGFTIELPLQGWVCPPGSFLKSQISFATPNPVDGLTLHLAGRVTARPCWVGLFETGNGPL